MKNILQKDFKEFKGYDAFTIKCGVLVNPLNNIEGTRFINVSGNPTKIEIDIDILGDYAFQYLDILGEQSGIPKETLKQAIFSNTPKEKETREKILELTNEELKKINVRIDSKYEFIEAKSILNEQKKFLEQRIEYLQNQGDIFYEKDTPLFRVSIPFLRTSKRSYCGTLFLKEEDFLEGILVFDKNFGKFPIKILEEHKFLINDFYTRFISMLENICLNQETFPLACPDISGKTEGIGHFCTQCIKVKTKESRRNVRKALFAKRDSFFKCEPKRTLLKIKKVKKYKVRKEEI